jgi:hypothetical protein
MTRSVRIWALLALPAAVAGCAGEPAASPATVSPAAVSPAGTTAAAAGPPQSARMICDDDIRSKVQQALDLPAAPHTAATWADSVYTCRYALPMGPMTLSVRVLSGDAQAAARLAADQRSATGARPLAGLGERAWGTPAGTAAVLKDNQILTVDTTRLPAVVGSGSLKRTDLAYEVALDVLGCWAGG